MTGCGEADWTDTRSTARAVDDVATVPVGVIVVVVVAAAAEKRVGIPHTGAHREQVEIWKDSKETAYSKELVASAGC